MPHAKNGTLRIRCAAEPEAWRLTWSPVPTLPENLAPDVDEDSMDICGRWARRTGAALGSSLECRGGCLMARVPR
jgi:hypothetical protein